MHLNRPHTVDFYNITSDVTDLSFLSKYGRIRVIDFVNGDVCTSAVRSLRGVLYLENLQFEGDAQIDAAAVLRECEAMPSLRQVIIGTYVPRNVLAPFEKKRPDVFVMVPLPYVDPTLQSANVED